MSQTRAIQNATALVVRNVPVIVSRIRMRQLAGAAPVLYLQLFNSAAPTVGTTAPRMVLPVPPGNTKRDVATLDVQLSGNARHFDTALAIAVTTVYNGSVAPTAGQEPEIIIDWEPYT